VKRNERSRDYGSYTAKNPHDNPPKKTDKANHGENLEKFEAVPSLNLGFEETLLAGIGGGGRSRRKASSGDILLHECILLVPPLADPRIKLFGVIQRHIRDAEPTPIKVDRLRRLTTKVSAGKGEKLFAELPSAGGIVAVRQLIMD